MPLVFNGHVCKTGQSFVVSFDGPDAEYYAVEYIRERHATHVFDNARTDENGVPLVMTYALERAMYPSQYGTCPHGLSSANCYGPGHWTRPDEWWM